MHLSGYLVIRQSKGFRAPNAKFVVKKPAIESNEIAIKIECTIPDELFTRPQLKFKIDIPKEAVPQKEISAEVVGNIQELIQQNTGIDIKLITE
jgi:hypothetical protein